MKRYVARSTGGDGMTHWYEYWDGACWVPDISKAVFYENSAMGEVGVRSGYWGHYREDVTREFTMIEVELTIREKA